MATPKFCPNCRCAIRDADTSRCPRCRHEFVAPRPSGKPPHMTREPFSLLSSVASLLDFLGAMALAGSLFIAVGAYLKSNWTLMMYPVLVLPQALLMFAASGLLRLCLDIRKRLL